MERYMRGIALCEHIRRKAMRYYSSEVKDMNIELREQNFHSIILVANFTDNRWTRAIVDSFR